GDRSLAASSLFFFQAEDGIRDFHVTGVQTCALPIFVEDEEIKSQLAAQQPYAEWLAEHAVRLEELPEREHVSHSASSVRRRQRRSEERRVGKEWRARRAPGDEKRRAVTGAP